MFFSGLQDHRISDHLCHQLRERHKINNTRGSELARQYEWVRIPLQVMRNLICLPVKIEALYKHPSNFVVKT